MTKSKLNLLIEALLLLCLAGIAGIGILIKHVLVPGFQRLEIYGRNVDLFFLGLNRHEWGTIHYAVGWTFLALMVLHIVLHWTAIVGICRRLIPNRQARWIAAAALLALTVFLVIFSALVKPEVREGGHMRQTPVRRMP